MNIGKYMHTSYDRKSREPKITFNIYGKDIEKIILSDNDSEYKSFD